MAFNIGHLCREHFDRKTNMENTVKTLTYSDSKRLIYSYNFKLEPALKHLAFPEQQATSLKQCLNIQKLMLVHRHRIETIPKDVSLFCSTLEEEGENRSARWGPQSLMEECHLLTSAGFEVVYFRFEAASVHFI